MRGVGGSVKGKEIIFRNAIGVDLHLTVFIQQA
jgi:hypothetical protein